MSESRRLATADGSSDCKRQDPVWDFPSTRTFDSPVFLSPWIDAVTFHVLFSLIIATTFFAFSVSNDFFSSICIVKRAPDGVQPAVAFGIAGREAAVIVGAEHGDGGACLGQAVGVDEVDVRKQPQGRLDRLGRHPSAPV